MDIASLDVRKNIFIDNISDIQHSSSEEILSRYSKDIYYEFAKPLIITQPKNTYEISKIIKAVEQAKLTLTVRGGGLSYSGGYLTNRNDTVVVDMRYCNKIIEINQEDMYVNVEAGVTWKQLNETLEPLGLRTPFWGTGSGLYATVGGGLSQNAINYGSGRYGTVAESVTSLKVILANGSELRTGSWGTDDNPSPFNRYYGPDLTGLFLADSGALAVKAEASLQLIPRPKETRFLAFSFAQRNDFVSAISNIGRQGLVSECFGFDPFFLSERIVSTGFADDIKKLLGVAKNQSSILKGVSEAFKVAAAGRRYLKDVGYTLHMTIDGRDADDVDSSYRIIKNICTKDEGKEIEASIPRLMRGTPFPPPQMLLGPRGDRWVPMHGIVPHSLHGKLLNEIDNYMNSQKEIIEQHNLVWGQVSNLIGNSRILIEVNLYWKDRLTNMLESYLDESFLRKKDRHDHNPEAYNSIDHLRKGLSNLFRNNGGTHMQIGRSYPFMESRMESVSSLIKSLKNEIDPNNIINPGSLSL